MKENGLLAYKLATSDNIFITVQWRMLSLIISAALYKEQNASLSANALSTSIGELLHEPVESKLVTMEMRGHNNCGVQTKEC